jgi:mitochondrial cardiolipin hydrolase
MDDTPDILFSPEDGIIDRIMEKVLSAQEAADIVVFLIGSKRAANALIKAHAKGVSVRMIIDGKVARSRYSQHRFLVKKGIEVKTVKVRGGSLHSKFVLIDHKTLIAGSANLTNDANYRNHEFAFVSRDPAIIGRFQDKFQELWAAGSKKQGKGGLGGMGYHNRKENLEIATD